MTRPARPPASCPVLIVNARQRIRESAGSRICAERQPGSRCPGNLESEVWQRGGPCLPVR